jgi:hypothetical protein
MSITMSGTANTAWAASRLGEAALALGHAYRALSVRQALDLPGAGLLEACLRTMGHVDAQGPFAAARCSNLCPCSIRDTSALQIEGRPDPPASDSPIREVPLNCQPVAIRCVAIGDIGDAGRVDGDLGDLGDVGLAGREAFLTE